MMTKSNHKMRIAREALKRLAGKPATAHGSGPAPTPACVAKLDRTQGYCSLDPTPALKGIPGLMSGQGHRVRPPGMVGSRPTAGCTGGKAALPE